MFKTISNTYYGGGINRGRAVVDVDRNFHASRIDFIYEIDKSDNWKFYYENNNCLTEEEKQTWKIGLLLVADFLLKARISLP